MTKTTYQGQNYLIESMAALKLRDDVFYENENGVCFGLLIMAIQAFLCGELQPFKERIDKLYRMHRARVNIKLRINTALRRVALRSQLCRKTGDTFTLTQDEQELIDIWAFFDGIASYQQPSKLQVVFNKKIRQAQVDEVAAFIACEALEKKGGLAIVGSWHGYYLASELELYLTLIAKYAKLYHQQIALSFTTGCLGRPIPHGAALCWEKKENTWHFINANGLPIRTFAESETRELASAIIENFWDENVTAFNTTLYAAGENVTQVNKFMHALHYASEFRKMHESLLAKASYQIKRLDLNKSLGVAANNGNEKEVKQCLRKGAELNKANKFHKVTPLLLAVKKKHLKVIKVLINHPLIDLNVADKDGCTALHLAVKMQSYKITKLLVKKGADLNIPNHVGKTPLDIMAESRNSKIIKLLIQHCDDTKKLLPLLANVTQVSMKTEKQIEIFDLLLQKFIECNQHKKALHTFLEFIAASHIPKLLHLLINHKINLAATNSNGHSLLSIAEHNGSTGFVNYYKLTSDSNEVLSKKEKRDLYKNHKNSITGYVYFLNEEDSLQSKKLLKKFEHREALSKLNFFSKNALHFGRSKATKYEKQTEASLRKYSTLS